MNEITFKNEPELGGTYSGNTRAELDMILRDALTYDPKGKSDVVKGVKAEIAYREGKEAEKDDQSKIKVHAMSAEKVKTKRVLLQQPFEDLKKAKSTPVTRTPRAKRN